MKHNNPFHLNRSISTNASHIQPLNRTLQDLKQIFQYASILIDNTLEHDKAIHIEELRELKKAPDISDGIRCISSQNSGNISL